MESRKQKKVPNNHDAPSTSNFVGLNTSSDSSQYQSFIENPKKRKRDVSVGRGNVQKSNAKKKINKKDAKKGAKKGGKKKSQSQNENSQPEKPKKIKRLSRNVGF